MMVLVQRGLLRSEVRSYVELALNGEIPRAVRDDREWIECVPAPCP
jgi:hypothetical protein